MVDYVGGDPQRIFVNPALGCPAECSYCYLPDQDLELGISLKSEVTAGDLIGLVRECGHFVPGRNGSLISVGCFTECWDASSKAVTVDPMTRPDFF